MKKLLTLFAFLVCALGANAVEIVDAYVDFSKYTDISEVKWAGWGASEEARSRLSIKDGCLHFESAEATDPSWDCQFFPIGCTAEEGVTYTLHFKIKGDHSENLSLLGFGQTPYGQFSITDEWVEGAVDYEATSSDGNLLLQCGSYVGSFDIAYLKITHEGKEEKPVEWIEMLTNGNAETAWPSWATEGDPNETWKGDRTPEICAWAKTKGRNEGPSFDDPEKTGFNPFPADIEVDPDDPGNHVFVVHGAVADTEGDASAWDNMFWIEAPRMLKSGEEFMVSFRYKASAAVKSDTQIHYKNPSQYLIWHAIGEIAFETEWKEFNDKLTIGDDMDGGWSIAFNLNKEVKDAVDFYFDNLSFQEMKLDHGWFVAAANTATGVEYDYDAAIQFEVDPADPETVVATVGKVGNQDSWVNEVMISTVYGNGKAFRANTINPAGTITGNDDSNWQDYVAKSSAKIALPAAGVWQITIAPEDNQILFMELEGDEPVAKEPVEIVTNTTVFVVKALEREPTAAEQPADEEAGTPAGTGQPWDNQFWIAANRDLAKGEVTVVKFQYKSSIDAHTSTQVHKVGDDGLPCTYLHYESIGNVDFEAADWKPFETTFTITNGDDGMRSIVFNMAEIKDACDYYIKDVQWYMYDATLAEAGQTMENLINADNTDNFYVKVGGGSPLPYGTETGISNVTAKSANSSAVIYNLAGQRVANSFKGIVVKDGKKFVK